MAQRKSIFRCRLKILRFRNFDGDRLLTCFRLFQKIDCLQSTFIICLFMTRVCTLANPIGENVIAGQAEVSHLDNQTSINQFSDRVIIDWQDFSNNQGEVIQFFQPSTTAAALNRVVTGAPSKIFGNIEANGQVFLINPNGILVGETGVINTQTFVGSTHDITNSSFLNAADLQFMGDSIESVVNEGTIKAEGGDIVLISTRTVNRGELIAADGTIYLAAGSEVFLKQFGDDHFSVRYPNGDGSVENQGIIEAARIELKAAGNNPYALAINHSGLIRSVGAEKINGKVILSADSGITEVSGDIIADYDGGEVHIFSEDKTIFTGNVVTPGRGEVHISGKEELSFTGVVDTEGGTLVLDPVNVELTSGIAAAGFSKIDPANIISGLTNNNVVIHTSDTSVGNGDIRVTDSLVYSSTNSLSLLAHRHIEVNADIQNDNAGDVNLVAGWDGVSGFIASAGQQQENGLVDMDAILAGINAFGNNGGTITVGNQIQVAGVAVGSRFGRTAVATENLIIAGGTGVDNAYAQVGFRTDSSQTNLDVDGMIRLEINDSLSAIGGSGNGSYVQLGHGGIGDSMTLDTDRELAGDIDINVGGEINLVGGSGEAAYAQIGHGGHLQEGNYLGDISVNGENIAFSGGGTNSYAQLGHGGKDTNGTQNGEILVSANDVIFSGGSQSAAYAQLGHGGVDSGGAYDGSITAELTGNILFSGGSGKETYVQLGHGGSGTNGDITGLITATARNAIFNGGSGEKSYAQLGHGGSEADSNSSSDVIVAISEDLSLSGGSGDGSHSQLGHGGVDSVGDQSGFIAVTGNNLNISGGSGDNAYAQLGHGDGVSRSSGNRQGAISAEISGEISLVDGSESWLIGHRTRSTNGVTDSDISLKTGSLDYDTNSGSSRVTFSQSFANIFRQNLFGGSVIVEARGRIGDDGNLINDGSWNIQSDHDLTLVSSQSMMIRLPIINSGNGNIGMQFGQSRGGTFFLIDEVRSTGGDVEIGGGNFSDLVVIGTGSGPLLLLGKEGDDRYVISLTVGSGVTTISEEVDEGTDVVSFVGTTNDDLFSLNIDGELSGGNHIVNIETGLDHVESFILDGQTGTDTLIGPNSEETWLLSGNGSGLIDILPFSRIANLRGGSMNDIFHLDDGIFWGGLIDGGAGINTLDFSDFTGGVTANLRLGTGIEVDRISRIQKILGGVGDDNLTPSVMFDTVLEGGLGDDQYSVEFFGSSNDITTLIIENADEGSDTVLFTDAEGVSNNYRLELNGDFRNGTFHTVQMGEGFGNIETARLIDTDNNTDSILAPDAMNQWDITATGRFLQPQGFSRPLEFDGIENLIGGSGNDFLNYDRLNGNPGNITFNGGRQGADVGDAITISTGALLNSVSYTQKNNSSAGGGYTINMDGTILSFDDVELFVDVTSASGKIFNFTSLDDVISLEDLPGAADGFSRILDNRGFLDEIGFFNPHDELVLNTGGGDDQVSVGVLDSDGTHPFLGTVIVNGGSHINGDQFIGPEISTRYEISSFDSGIASIENYTVSFDNIESLKGNIEDDTFVVSNGALWTGSIDGGSGFNSIDFSEFTGAVTVNLETQESSRVFGGLANIQEGIGGSGNDSLVASTTADTVLQGGAGNDDYLIELNNTANEILVTVIEDQDKGTDAVRIVSDSDSDQNYSLAANGDLLNGTSHTVSLGMGFANLETVNLMASGGGSNSLTAPDTQNQWNINALQQVLAPAGFETSLTFSGIVTLNGGLGDDTLSYDRENGDPGNLIFNGGGESTLGGDALIIENGLPLSTVTYTFTDQFENGNSGSVDLDGTLVTFSGLEPIIDTTIAESRVFNLRPIDDIGILGDNDTEDDGISILKSSNGTFDNTTFLNPLNSLRINAGDGDDQLVVNRLDNDSGIPFSGLVVVNGGGDDAGDQLIGPADSASYKITGADKGSVNGLGYQLEFTSVESVTAGDNDDDFIFQNGAALRGSIDGSAGINTLSDQSSDGLANQFTITGSNAGILEGKTSAFRNIQNLTGGRDDDLYRFLEGGVLDGTIDGGKGSNTIFGDNDGNEFLVSKANGGALNNQVSEFVNVQNLIGGEGEDTFHFANGFEISGSIDGGDGIDTLDHSASIRSITVDLGANKATGIGPGGVSGIEIVLGGQGNDTLSPSTGSDSTLVGGGGNDRFVLAGSVDANYMGLTITLDGGVGQESLRINDADDSDGEVYLFSGTDFEKNTTKLQLAGLESVELFTGGGLDMVTVAGSPIFNLFLDGGNPTESPGDVLAIPGQDFILTGFNSGTAGDSIQFANFENLSIGGGQPISTETSLNLYIELQSGISNDVNLSRQATSMLNESPLLVGAVTHSDGLSLDLEWVGSEDPIPWSWSSWESSFGNMKDKKE